MPSQNQQQNTSMRQTNNNPSSGRNAIKKPVPQSSIKKQQQEPVCITHNKKLEAYCQNDKITLCIDCILSDQHKSHEIHSIQKAADLEKESIQIKYLQSQELRQNLSALNTDINGHLETLKEQALKNTHDIRIIFQEIRNIIDDKEAQIIHGIQRQLESEQNYLIDKKAQNVTQIDQIQNFEIDYKQFGEEDDIMILSKTQERQLLCEASLQQVQKVNFNHVFKDIARNKELLAISKVFKDASSGKDPNSASSNHKQSFAAASGTQTPQNQNQGSSYMQVTHSWQNKNKPSSGAGGQSSTNVIPPAPLTAPGNSRGQKSGVSTIRSQSKDRRLMPNKGKKGLADTGSSGVNNTSSFNLAGSFNSTELMSGISNQQTSTSSQTPIVNKTKTQDLLRTANNVSSLGQQSKPQSNANFEDFSKAFKGNTSSKEQTVMSSFANAAQNQAQSQTSSQASIQILSQQTSQQKDKKANPIPIPPQNQMQGTSAMLSNVSPRPKTSSCYVPRSINSQNDGQTTQGNKETKPKEHENLLQKANSLVQKSQPQSLAELRNKVKSQKNNSLALQTQEDNINMLKKYKTQLESENSNDKESNQDDSLLRDNNNQSTRQYETSQKMNQKSDQDRKQELLQKALGISSSLDGGKENASIKNTKQAQKKKYLNQAGSTGSSGKGGIQTTVCHVDLMGDPLPLVKEYGNSDKQQTFEMANEMKISNEEMLMMQSEMRGNMSITKSMVDFYHNYKSGIGSDDLMSLYKHNQQFIYVISGFCENSLGHVERLNVDTMTWEEVASVKVPRTKFCVVQSPQTPTDIMILGGKDQDGQRTDAIEVYNCESNTWANAEFKMRKPRSGFAAVTLKNENKIYVIGGNDGRVQNRVECLNLNTKLWSKIPKMNMKRDELAACLGPDNKIYAIGGYGGGDNACLSSAERFDPSTGKWELIAPMKEARRALTAVALPDGIYAIGGYNGKDYINTVERYDFFSNEWTQIKSMKKARCTLAAVASSDCQYIYAVGGFNGTPLSAIERYDITNEEWEENMPPMKQKRFMHSCIMDKSGYQFYDMAILDFERVLKGQDRMYLLHVRNVLNYNIQVQSTFLSAKKIMFKEQAAFSIDILKKAQAILQKLEKDSATYLLFSFGESPGLRSGSSLMSGSLNAAQQQSGSNISLNQGSLASQHLRQSKTSQGHIKFMHHGKHASKNHMTDSLNLRQSQVKFFTSNGSQGQIGGEFSTTNSFYTPVTVQLVGQHNNQQKTQRVSQFSIETTSNQPNLPSSQLSSAQHTQSILHKFEQKQRSSSADPPLQRNILNIMKSRLSAYDYTQTPRSDASYCSFDSYIEHTRDAYDPFNLEHHLNSHQNRQTFKDTYTLYHERILKVKVLHALKVHYIKQKTYNKIHRKPIKSHKQLFLIALIKQQYGSFDNFLAARSNQKYSLKPNPEHFQKHLWILYRSLSLQYSKHVQRNDQKFKIIFDKGHRLKAIAMSKLKKWVTINKKKRALNMKAVQYFLSKYNTISFKHWLNIVKYRKKRAQKFAKIFKKLINRKRIDTFQRMSALVTNKQLFKKFMIERENFLYNLNDHDFYINNKKMERLLEGSTLSTKLNDSTLLDQTKPQYNTQKKPSGKQITLNNNTQSMLKKPLIPQLQIELINNSQKNQMPLQKSSIQQQKSQVNFEQYLNADLDEPQPRVQKLDMSSPVSRLSMISPHTQNQGLYNNNNTLNLTLETGRSGGITTSILKSTICSPQSALSPQNFTFKLLATNNNTKTQHKIKTPQGNKLVAMKMMDLNSKIKRELATQKLLKSRNSNVNQLSAANSVQKSSISGLSFSENQAKGQLRIPKPPLH